VNAYGRNPALAFAVLAAKVSLKRRTDMIKKLALVAALAIAPAASFAQQNPQGAQGGALGGATAGAVGGAVVGGPVGAAVGGVGGAVVGAIIGDNTPALKTYVVEQRVRSYSYAQPGVAGPPPAPEALRYYEGPAGFNARAVLVDPQSRRIVQVIE